MRTWWRVALLDCFSPWTRARRDLCWCQSDRLELGSLSNWFIRGRPNEWPSRWRHRHQSIDKLGIERGTRVSRQWMARRWLHLSVNEGYRQASSSLKKTWNVHDGQRDRCLSRSFLVNADWHDTSCFSYCLLASRHRKRWWRGGRFSRHDKNDNEMKIASVGSENPIVVSDAWTSTTTTTTTKRNARIMSMADLSTLIEGYQQHLFSEREKRDWSSLSIRLALMRWKLVYSEVPQQWVGCSETLHIIQFDQSYTPPRAQSSGTSLSPSNQVQFNRESLASRRASLCEECFGHSSFQPRQCRFSSVLHWSKEMGFQRERMRETENCARG